MPHTKFSDLDHKPTDEQVQAERAKLAEVIAPDAAVAVAEHHLRDLLDAIDALAKTELTKIGEKGDRLLAARAHFHI